MRSLFRSVTGTPSSDQISDSNINDLLNEYYVYAMPAELKVQIENDFLDFKTTPGIDTYAFPGGYFTDSPGAYADGFPLIFYQDPDIFYQDWPQQYAVDNLFTGDGVTVAFSGGLQNPPIIVGTLFVTDGTQVLQDDGDTTNFPAGTLSGDGTGTIDYVTGALSITFNTAPAATDTIYAKYQGYQGNRPQGIMFFHNEFTVRPVPDQVYQIRMQGFTIPVSLMADGDVPQQQEWGPLIVYGAALQWFTQTGDLVNYNNYFPIFKRYENIGLSRTIQQYTPQQSVPRF